MKEEEIKSMPITPDTIIFLERVLNYLKENQNYMAQFNRFQIQYICETDGKEFYAIKREVII